MLESFFFFFFSHIELWSDWLTILYRSQNMILFLHSFLTRWRLCMLGSIWTCTFAIIHFCNWQIIEHTNLDQLYKEIQKGFTSSNCTIQGVKYVLIYYHLQYSQLFISYFEAIQIEVEHFQMDIINSYFVRFLGCTF